MTAPLRLPSESNRRQQTGKFRDRPGHPTWPGSIGWAIFGEPSAAVRLGTLAASALGLGWLLFHIAPSALDGALVSRRAAATALGPTPYFAALYAFVNIHHFLMDSVIWRRDNPETRYLFR